MKKFAFIIILLLVGCDKDGHEIPIQIKVDHQIVNQTRISQSLYLITFDDGSRCIRSANALGDTITCEWLLRK